MVERRSVLAGAGGLFALGVGAHWLDDDSRCSRIEELLRGGNTEFDRVACGGSGAVSVELDADELALPEDETEVTVRNDADESFAWGPGGWEFYHLDTGEGFGPSLHHLPLVDVPPGETVTRPLSVGVRDSRTDAHYAVEYPDPGTYAFCTFGDLGADRLALATTVRVVE